MLKQLTHFKTTFIILIVILQSCGPVRLISDYDEITDKTTVELQEKVSSLFVNLERNIGTDNAKYSNYTAFYDDIKVDINTLEIRAGAIDKNKIVQDQISEIKKMIDLMENLHKIGFTSVETLAPLKQPFNSAFTAMTKLQLGLKRGQK